MATNTDELKDNELLCPVMGCNSKDLIIFVHDWKFGSPATCIEIRCNTCGFEGEYELKLAQDALVDRIDET